MKHIIYITFIAFILIMTLVKNYEHEKIVEFSKGDWDIDYEFVHNCEKAHGYIQFILNKFPDIGLHCTLGQNSGDVVVNVGSNF